MNKTKYYLMTFNEYKFVRVIKYVISFVALWIIWLKRLFLPKNKINNSKKRRLFSTTGNLSLLKAISIINSLNDDNCEDYLIIDSAKGGYNFWKQNYEIAQMHNFKQIKFFYSIKYLTALRFANWTDFDEIYMLNHTSCLSTVMELYPNAEINLFDEGCGSLIRKNDSDLTKIKHFYAPKYIDRIDGYGFSDDLYKKMTTVDSKYFCETASKLAEKFPLKLNYNREDKNILFCAIYWQCSGLCEKDFVEEQQKQIQNLIDTGYKILFKPHPRETKYYGLDTNPNVIFMDSVLPIEIYDLDILAVTGMNCTTIIHLPHYHKIPAFSNISEKAMHCEHETAQANIVRAFVKEYTPDYKYLLGLDVKNTPKDILKEQIRKIYFDYINDKPLLSQNENIKVFAEKYGM